MFRNTRQRYYSFAFDAPKREIITFAAGEVCPGPSSSLTASFQVAGESYESDETDERLDSGVGNRGLDGIGGGLGGGDSCGSDLHDDEDDDDEPGCWCRS